MTTFGEELATQVIKNPGFLKDVNALLAYQFAATAHNKNLSLDNLQIKRLSEASVILASSPIDSHNRTAFEVITILYDQFRNRFPGIGGVTKLICSRLGNTPAIDLLDSSSLDLPVSLDVESQTKILANTVTFGGEALTLTDFQHESLELLSNAISLSLSAPTSAGKSFLITHFVVRQFAENIKYNAVIIVPTRALIRQLVADFSNVFYNYSGNHKLFSEISLVTSSAEPETNIASKRLFVLTQERLQAILYNWKHRPTFNLLVVDESQKISDSKRGIILEDSISELISSQPKMQAVFLSPLASNPSFLFDLVSPASANQSLHTMVSPVAQHVYTVRTSGTSYAKLTVNRVFQGTEDFLLDIETNREMPKRKAERLAFIVKLLSNQTSSLVYSNGPAEAEKNALALAKDQPRKTSEAINQTVQSLKDFIHEKYYLIDCLEKGVGYHYGSMPDIARGSVEDLFKSEKISLIACTSTLLEGVNLPAKNIFIDNPKLGHEPMDDSSFWNLAGRAGRLMKDLSGNVFCINQDKWETPVSQRIKEYKIESSLNKTINNEYFVNFCKDLGPAMDFESFEQATNNITLRYMERGADNTKRFLEKRTTPKNAEVILSSVAILRGSIAIPLDVLKKNKSIDIRFQQRFLDYLAQMSEERLIRLIPRQPMSQQYYDYLVNVFTICDKNFSLEQRSDGMIRYFAVIANQWTREESIKSMITSGIKYYGYEESSENINKLIRSLIDTLNKEIRFHYVRSTKCFCDLLEFELTRRNVSLQEMSYVDFGLPNYLELGMYQKGTIQLHNLGLSRTTAIEVNRYCRSKDVPPNEIVGWVRKRAREIQVARPCKIELLRFFS